MLCVPPQQPTTWQNKLSHFVMSTTAALPPLENLLKLSAKRTYAIFATDRDDTLREDEKRY